MTTLTQARLKELLHYDPNTGVFVGLPIRKHPKGYSTVRIDGATYFTHRLAVLYMTGLFPEEDTDHHNGDRSDNRWSNLSARTYCENQQNRGGPQKNNKLGILGVRRFGNRFMAQIRANRRQYYLGLFGTPEEASAAYMNAKRQLHHHSPRLLDISN